MTGRREHYEDALRRASDHALHWLDSVDERPIPPTMTADEVAAAVGGPLPDAGLDPAEVVDLLAAGAEPGLMAMGSGRFFGWVIGRHPAGRAGCGLARERVGPEHRHALRDARPRPRSRRSQAAGCSTCWDCPPAPTSDS